jgi:hypothetical protein
MACLLIGLDLIIHLSNFSSFLVTLDDNCCLISKLPQDLLQINEFDEFLLVFSSPYSLNGLGCSQRQKTLSII